MRATPVVRTADRDDLVVVASLNASARPSGPVGVGADQWGEDVVRNHLSVYIASGGTVLVADVDGHIVGFLLTRSVGPLLFALDPALVIDALFVTPDQRRRGVGHALVAGVAALAGEAGAPYVYASAPAGDRGMHRFLARLGFAPTAGHRVVSTPTLLRRLAQDGGAPRGDSRPRSRRDATRSAIDDIIARRRRARAAGLPSGPVDLRELRSGRDAERPAS
ncbi:GNAT family N-acetyltransferase [Xylanimonas ulmi]|uniref:Ribosomal protein S18 acetylase RimI-like enzyme n=1 Tax=Xylanimonas ulmi TaxID=228973 RepID=A0A4Q7LZ19_9MICO|nr:GNAT family N-acetyltransferase [Xylanibacterium ulmi]RZS60585.1 ribosomal protein S18 acetylase RimI-like enzyme [Xylanibacterium ulmi]